MNDMISRADALKECHKVADEAKSYGIPQMSMGAHTCRDAIRALPAVEVGAKSGEIERAVWDAMGWVLRHAKQLPGDIIPTYTDGGNSDAETECRRAAARIRSALTATPAQDVAGLVRRRAAQTLWDMLHMKNGAHEGMTHDEVRELWDSVRDEDGFSAVTTFLACMKKAAK